MSSETLIYKKEDFEEGSMVTLTMNKPETLNALNIEFSREIDEALTRVEQDDDVKVVVIKGAGKAFSAGYDLGRVYFVYGGGTGKPEDKSRRPSQRSRLAYDRWRSESLRRIFLLNKITIAQVHGYCLAGGTELATACDLVYVADDAKIGYPVVRSISPPDNQFYPWIVGLRRAMELMLTGDHMSGLEAVESGFANRAFPEAELEENVLKIAERVAKTPSDLQQINKRAVHRQMDAMGIRAGIRAGTEMQQLATYTATTQAHLAELREGLTAALSKRDSEFGDYRTSSKKP